MVSEIEARLPAFDIECVLIKCNGYHDNNEGKMAANWPQLFAVLIIDRLHLVRN